MAEMSAIIPSTDTPDEVTLAYVAGFFDGEGYVSIKVNKGIYYSLCVGIANTNRDIIDYIQSILGGSVSIVYPNGNPRHKHTMYYLNWFSTNAMGMLQTICPFLRVKRDLAITGIMYWNDCVSGKPRNELNSESLDSLRESYKVEMDSLQINNRRRVYV